MGFKDYMDKHGGRYID